MSFLRGSTNYVWCTTSVLGKGATGAVFQGVNKKSGESVAVKTFNQMSQMRPQDVQMREFEVLRKVNHENIVKLLDIEDDQEGRGKVIVMELCTGGSLFSILDDPENTYGLPEKEFLLVLEHLSAGMKHLRDNNIVHRDLKPGNIMKFISDTGHTIYKLTDFGAARELQENQPFMSLYGTEEYLHPAMYERAVLRKNKTKSFTANVDLWSIGVTLYHVATGNLPFRPYGGRKNKETMHLITTQKTSGVISGIQMSEGGQIEWSKVLPKHCQLSEGLKLLVTPLLAGLMESNEDRMWRFDRFFDEVTKILSKKVMHLFYVHRAQSIEVFLDEYLVKEPLMTFKEFIRFQTNIQPENQILLYNNADFEKYIDPNTSIKGYPDTRAVSPIYLFSTDNYNVILPVEHDLPKFPVFPANVSVESDASLSKVACSVGHECKRRIERLTLTDTLMKTGVDTFIYYISNTMKDLNNKSKYMEELYMTMNLGVETVNMLAKKTKYAKEAQGHMDAIANLERNVRSLMEPIKTTYKTVIVDELLQSEWKGPIRNKKCPCKTSAVPRAKHLVDRLRESWQHLLRDRATRSLTYNDEQFHALEKIKINETGRRLKNLLEDEVKVVVSQIAEHLGDWYIKAQTFYVKTSLLYTDYNRTMASINSLYEEVSQLKDQLESNVGKNEDNQNNLWMTKVISQTPILSEIKMFMAHKDEVRELLKMNKKLIEELKISSVNKGDNDDIIKEQSRL